MRISRAKAAVLLAVLCAGTAQAGAAQHEDAQAAAARVMAMEGLWAQATAMRDTKAVTTVLDDAFLYIDFDGKFMTKAELLLDLQNSGLEQAVTEHMLVKVHGSTTIVTGIFRVKGVRGGKPFEHRGRFLDTWVLKNGIWVCALSQLTPIAQE